MQILLPQPTPADFAQKTPFDAASTNGKKTREMDLCMELQRIKTPFDAASNGKKTREIDLCVELDLPRALLPATVAVSKRAWCVEARFVTSG